MFKPGESAHKHPFVHTCNLSVNTSKGQGKLTNLFFPFGKPLLTEQCLFLAGIYVHLLGALTMLTNAKVEITGKLRKRKASTLKRK